MLDVPPSSDCDLQFKNKDPGAVKYGNFINYYKFNPPKARLDLLPKNILRLDNVQEVICLDIGCNTGDLTAELQTFVTESTQKACKILGIDIDPTLVLRANEAFIDNSHISFKTCNVMEENSNINPMTLFLQENSKIIFDITFCFSVTMWIHINHGDEGLKKFIRNICSISNVIVVEPQPYKCYLKAVRRLKRAGSEFPNFKSLRIKHNIEESIEHFIVEQDFVKVYESDRTQWERKLLVFNRK